MENGFSSPSRRRWIRRYRRNSRSALRSSAPSALTNSTSPFSATPKYGVDPRASTRACRRSRSGRPTRRSPSITPWAVGRREGAPAATNTAAPATHPTTADHSQANDTGESMKAETIVPSSRAHPARRHPRLIHGAAAVRPAATAPTPHTVGKPSLLSGPRLAPTSTRVRPSSRSMTVSPMSTSNSAEAAAATTVTSSRHRRPHSAQTSPAVVTTTREDPRPDDDDVDHPRRQGVQTPQQVGREADECPAEQPLHEQQRQRDGDGDDQPQHVGRRAFDLSLHGAGHPAHRLLSDDPSHRSGTRRRCLGTRPPGPAQRSLGFLRVDSQPTLRNSCDADPHGRPSSAHRRRRGQPALDAGGRLAAPRVHRGDRRQRPGRAGDDPRAAARPRAARRDDAGPRRVRGVPPAARRRRSHPGAVPHGT